MEKLKLLLVDDSKVVIQLYKEGLSSELYDKKFAVNGEEALTIYKAWAPDLILLDIVMPAMSGFVVLKTIRDMEKKSGRNTPIVMATALSDKSDIVDCLRVGIQGYIVKPFKPEELAAKLEGYYAAHKQRDHRK